MVQNGYLVHRCCLAQVTNEELSRQQRITEVMTNRLDAAEKAAVQATSEAQKARRAMDEYLASGRAQDLGGGGLVVSPSLSGSSIRKTLQVMHQAHKVLFKQAELLSTVFPPGKAVCVCWCVCAACALYTCSRQTFA